MFAAILYLAVLSVISLTLADSTAVGQDKAFHNADELTYVEEQLAR